MHVNPQLTREAYRAAMRKALREVLRDALGHVVLGGYPVAIYRTPVATLATPLPPPDKRGLLVFDQEGLMVVWDGGGVGFYDAEWVRTYVVAEH